MAGEDYFKRDGYDGFSRPILNYPITNTSPITFNDNATLLEIVAVLQNVVIGLIDKQNAMIEADKKLTYGLNSMFKSFVDDEDSKFNDFAASLKKYLDAKIDEFTDYGVEVYDPTTGKSAPFITAVNNAYDWARVYGLFASQFDAQGLTCDGIESLDWACRYLETAHTRFKNWDPATAGTVTVEGDDTGSLPADLSTTVADMSATVTNISATVASTSATVASLSATAAAQRLARIVPGTANPLGGTLPVTTPPASTQFIIQPGSVYAPVNEFGDFSFDWPEAFPSAILSVQLTSGENVPRVQGPIALRSATTLTTCRANAIGRTSGNVRCDYIAIGY